jgi:heavy metal sensor kinase
MARGPLPVRTRLTLWYSLALALPLIALAITSYVIFSHTLRERTDAFLGDALTVFARELVAERRAEPDGDDAIARTLREVRFREVDIVILDDSGRVIGTSAPVGDEAAEALGVPLADPGRFLSETRLPGPDTASIRTVHRGGSAFRVLERPLAFEGRAFRMAGIHPLIEVETTLRLIRHAFAVAIPLFILLAALGGSLLARRSFRPVVAMAGRAAEIGASTLNERLPVGADDELGKLARVLNDLLDRLERSFELQRRFMTDASHELRTPTAIVRTEADVILSRERRTEEEYRASMAIIRDASRRLARIVDDVFLIARADAGHLAMNPATLHLDELVRENVRAVGPIAEGKHITFTIGGSGEAELVGDADLLDRLLLNLLDNAIRHSPEGGTIAVERAIHDGVCDLSIVDAGPGIPADAGERIFERFFRLDTARSREEASLTSGAGLGLAIGRRIAEMHGGTLVLAASRPGRTEFRVTLPLAPAEAPTRRR